MAACDGQFDFDVDSFDAAPPLDSGPSRPQELGSPDARAGHVACGSSPCVLSAHACCITGRSFCIEVNEVACRGTLVNCDGTNDCPHGQSCCATLADAGVTSIECRDSCAAPEHVTLCDPTDPNECGACGPSSLPLPAEYFQCY